MDPTVKPVTHARRKVPVKSKEAIDKELDYLIEEEIHHGASRANTVGLFSDLSEETKWRSKGMSGSKQLEQGHHQRAP